MLTLVLSVKTSHVIGPRNFQRQAEKLNCLAFPLVQSSEAGGTRAFFLRTLQYIAVY